MTNLFSSFDPMVSYTYFSAPLNWVSCFIVVFIIPQMFWLVDSQITKSIGKLIDYLEDELIAVFSPVSLPGTIHVFISFFLFIIFSNFMGLFPYIFTATSHISITLTLALPIWLGSILLSAVFQTKSMLAHLVPTGTPGALMPIMVIIESVRNIIRPGTLSVRLGANIMAGHLLLTLLGSQGPLSASVVLLLLMVALILLLILEVGVACIQSYVFTVLRSLYLNELSRLGFNKLIVLWSCSVK